MRPSFWQIQRSELVLCYRDTSGGVFFIIHFQRGLLPNRL
jgi:hypothetical protein